MKYFVLATNFMYIYYIYTCIYVQAYNYGYIHSSLTALNLHDLNGILLK